MPPKPTRFRAFEVVIREFLMDPGTVLFHTDYLAEAQRFFQRACHAPPYDDVYVVLVGIRRYRRHRRDSGIYDMAIRRPP